MKREAASFIESLGEPTDGDEDEEIQRGLRSLRQIKHRMTFLSDTIAIGIWDCRDADMALGLMGELVDVAIQSALRTEPFVNLRGVVTYGAFRIEGNFIVGPAVDEAAELEKAAEAALVWLAPSALTVCVDDNNPYLARIAVPMKGGQRFNTYVVHTLADAARYEGKPGQEPKPYAPTSPAPLRERMLAAFNDGPVSGRNNLGIALKRDNTLQAIGEMQQWARSRSEG